MRQPPPPLNPQALLLGQRPLEKVNRPLGFQGPEVASSKLQLRTAESRIGGGGGLHPLSVLVFFLNLFYCIIIWHVCCEPL